MPSSTKNHQRGRQSCHWLYGTRWTIMDMKSMEWKSHGSALYGFWPGKRSSLRSHQHGRQSWLYGTSWTLMEMKPIERKNHGLALYGFWPRKRSSLRRSRHSSLEYVMGASLNMRNDHELGERIDVMVQTRRRRQEKRRDRRRVRRSRRRDIVAN